MYNRVQDIEKDLLEKQKGLQNRIEDLELGKKLDELKLRIKPVLADLKAKVDKMEAEELSTRIKNVEDAYIDNKRLREVLEQGGVYEDGRTKFAVLSEMIRNQFNKTKAQVISQFDEQKKDFKAMLDNTTVHIHEELKTFSNELVEFRKYFEEVQRSHVDLKEDIIRGVNAHVLDRNGRSSRRMSQFGASFPQVPKVPSLDPDTAISRFKVSQSAMPD